MAGRADGSGRGLSLLSPRAVTWPAPKPAARTRASRVGAGRRAGWSRRLRDAFRRPAKVAPVPDVVTALLAAYVEDKPRKPRKKT